MVLAILGPLETVRRFISPPGDAGRACLKSNVVEIVRRRRGERSQQPETPPAADRRATRSTSRPSSRASCRACDAPPEEKRCTTHAQQSFCPLLSPRGSTGVPGRLTRRAGGIFNMGPGVVVRYPPGEDVARSHESRKAGARRSRWNGSVRRVGSRCIDLLHRPARRGDVRHDQPRGASEV